MPNRIIKESIRESYRINVLSPQAEILFYRMITYADDFGIFKSDTRLLNKALFPLKDYKIKDVGKWVNELVIAGLIVIYIAEDSKPYGYFISWLTHQSKRNNRSKYPEFTDKCKSYDSIEELMKAIEFNFIIVSPQYCYK